MLRRKLCCVEGFFPVVMQVEALRTQHNVCYKERRKARSDGSSLQ